MGSICVHVKEIREGVYFISIAESVFHEAKETKMELVDGKTPLLSCTLSYKGNGTFEKLEIKLSELMLKKELSTTCLSVPTISFIKNGLCKVANPIKYSDNTLNWRCEFLNLQAGVLQCPHLSTTSKCDNCSVFFKTPFSIDILIDFMQFYSSVLRITPMNEETLHNLSSILADVTFKVGDQTIRAHSTILSSKSKVFSGMFQQNIAENKIITVEDTKPAVFRLLLQFLYGKASGFEQEEILIPDLLLAAEKYGLESLKKECSTILEKKKKLDLLDAVRSSSHSALNEPFTLKGGSQVQA